MSTTWTQDDNILTATINGNEYQIYETEPGIQRLRRNGRLIAETFTVAEAQRWAETFDKWREQELMNVRFSKRDELPRFTDMSDAFKVARAGWQRFPRYPSDMERG